jgi:hypothetical protein
MKSPYFTFVIHCALFLLAFGLEDTRLLFTFSALAGLFPRRHVNFFQYLSASVTGLLLLFVFFQPNPEVSALLAEVLGLGSIHLYVIVTFVTALTSSFTAVAVNRITLPAKKKQNQYMNS